MSKFAGFFSFEDGGDTGSFVIIAQAKTPADAIKAFRVIFLETQALPSSPLAGITKLYLDGVVRISMPGVVMYQSRRTPPPEFCATICCASMTDEIATYGWSPTGKEPDGDSVIEPFWTSGDGFTKEAS